MTVLGAAIAITIVVIANRPPSAGPASIPNGAMTAAADGGSYLNTDALLAALQQAGIPCTAASPIANPTRPGALSMTDCTGATGSDTVIVVFDNHADAQAYAESITEQSWVNATGLPAEAVFGVNWAVNTIPAYGQPVLAALGGSSLTAMPTPSATLGRIGRTDSA